MPRGRHRYRPPRDAAHELAVDSRSDIVSAAAAGAVRVEQEITEGAEEGEGGSSIMTFFVSAC